MKFSVKDKSLHTFFGITKDDRREIDSSPYYLMKEEIILPRNKDLPRDSEAVVIFELEDISQMSRKRLINTYTYKLDSYDDVSVRLTLIDFNITLDGK